MDDVKESLEFCSAVFTAVEASLESHDFSENIAFPELRTMTQSRLPDFTPNLLKEIDPIIRLHIRLHSKYYSAPGANGGIGLKSVKAAKEAAKAAKIAAKNALNAELDAKLAGATNE